MLCCASDAGQTAKEAQPTSSTGPASQTSANASASAQAAAIAAAQAALLAEPKDPLRVEETLDRILHHRGVHGLLIVNQEGVVIRSNLDNIQTIQYSNLLSQLAQKARSVIRDLDPENDMRFLRVRTKKNEMMVSLVKQYLLIVIQSPDEQ